MHWPEAQEKTGNREPLSTQQNVALRCSVATQVTHKHENFSKTKEDHEIWRKDTNSHSRCIQTILLLYWQVLLLSVKAKAAPPNMTWTGSVLWPKPSSTDCLHQQHSAPGPGSPLALRQGSCSFSQPLFSTLCFHFTAKRSPNVKAGPRQQPRVCSTNLRVSHTKTRCKGNSGLHKGPQPFQTIHNHLRNKTRR